MLAVIGAAAVVQVNIDAVFQFAFKCFSDPTKAVVLPVTAERIDRFLRHANSVVIASHLLDLVSIDLFFFEFCCLRYLDVYKRQIKAPVIMSAGS